MNKSKPEANNKADPPAFAGAPLLGVMAGPHSHEIPSSSPVDSEQSKPHPDAESSDQPKFQKNPDPLSDIFERLNTKNVNCQSSEIGIAIQLLISQAESQLECLYKLRRYVLGKSYDMTPNDPSSATRHTRRADCKPWRHAGFAAAHG